MFLPLTNAGKAVRQSVEKQPQLKTDEPRGCKMILQSVERWAGVVLGRLQSSGKFLAGWPGHQPGQQTRQENGKPSPPWTLELTEMPRHWQNIDFDY